MEFLQTIQNFHAEMSTTRNHFLFALSLFTLVFHSSIKANTFFFTTNVEALHALAIPAGGTIVGKVVEAGTNEPLIGANVVIKGTVKGSASDLDGKYEIRGVDPGTVVLFVSYMGFKEKEITVEVREGETTELIIELEWQGVEGEEVTITAQARGQVSAINEQLQSNTIANVVSKDRIQEVPDVNAAESIGRLPGVAIQRSGGEANKVMIRGLSPKFSTVTVNGVRLPTSGGDDRSVDLSLVSSSMLDGIEVKKAITPDMDGDAIAGSVDLKLREAPEGLAGSIMAQGGYTELQEYYENYKFSGTVSNRIFDNKLGFIITGNADQYDRSADQLNAEYRQYLNPLTDVYDGVKLESVNAQEYQNLRNRLGWSALVDYKLPKGKIMANAFYNELKNEGTVRTNNIFNIQNWGRVGNNLEINESTNKVFTAGITVEQNFDWIKLDAGLARTSSTYDSPNNYYAEFRMESAITDLAKDEDGVPLWNFDTLGVSPIDVLDFVQPNDSVTLLATTNINSHYQEEVNYTAQLNFEVPFDLNDNINGHVKFGGKVRWLDRKNDVELRAKYDWPYFQPDMNEQTGALNDQAELIKCVYDQTGLINGYNVFTEQVINAETSPFVAIPLHYFDTGEGGERSNFLLEEGGGGFPLGYTPGVDDMKRFIDALDNCTYQGDPAMQYDLSSRSSDYSGEERYDAAYIMSEINIGNQITLIPGVRWEHDYSRFKTERFETKSGSNIEIPIFIEQLDVERNYDFMLPMVHLQIDPLESLKIRMAYTQTLARPNYNQYMPQAYISYDYLTITANNTDLKPSESENFDISASIYQNKVGLLTISGFYKNIADLPIWKQRFITAQDTLSTADAMAYNIPIGRDFDGDGVADEADWLINSPSIATYINSPYDTEVWGLELDWQTNFWYLPSVLKGLVLNINYTRMFSETTYQTTIQKGTECLKNCGTPWQVSIPIYGDSTRTGRAYDQPAHLMNVTLGYDFKGFSARVSYLYQGDRLTGVGRVTIPVLDTYSTAYERWDVTVKQRVNEMVEFYANFNNLTSTPDRNIIGNGSGDTTRGFGSTTYVQYYGFTMDAGVRLKF